MLLENESHSVMTDSLRSHGLYSPWNSPGQNTRMGSLSLLQGILPTQGLNSGLHIAGRFFTAEPQEKLKDTGVGNLSLLQQVFPTQELNWGLLCCRQILYQLGYQESQPFKTSGYLHFHLRSLAPFNVFQMATTVSASNPNWKYPYTALSNRTFCNNGNTLCLHWPIRVFTQT